MNPDRRDILAGLGALALLPGCTTNDGPGPRPDVPFEPEGDVDASVFPLGLQTGDPAADGVVLQVHTTADDVTFYVARFTDSGWEDADAIEVSATDGVATHTLTGLQEDASFTTYATAGDSRSDTAQFRTTPLPDAQRVLRIGAVSCLGGNRPWPNLSAAAALDLDAFLLLGDTIYNDWGANTGARAKWEEALDQQGLRDVSAACPIIATWDDHEVWNNWDPEDSGDSALAEECRAEFRRAIPQRTGPNSSIWRKISFGSIADCFVLDCRGERGNGRYMSEEQLSWLEAELLASTATFKLVLNSVPITDFSWVPFYGDYQASDRWQGYPTERRRILDHIESNGIPGVLWVSGDFHVGGVIKVEPNSSSSPWEVLTGPGGSPVHDKYSLVPENEKVPALVAENNVVVLTLRPGTGEVLVEFLDNDGAVIRDLELDIGAV